MASASRTEQILSSKAANDLKTISHSLPQNNPKVQASCTRPHRPSSNNTKYRVFSEPIRTPLTVEARAHPDTVQPQPAQRQYPYIKVENSVRFQRVPVSAGEHQIQPAVLHVVEQQIQNWRTPAPLQQHQLQNIRVAQPPAPPASYPPPPVFPVQTHVVNAPSALTVRARAAAPLLRPPPEQRNWPSAADPRLHQEPPPQLNPASGWHLVRAKLPVARMSFPPPNNGVQMQMRSMKSGEGVKPMIHKPEYEYELRRRKSAMALDLNESGPDENAGYYRETGPTLHHRGSIINSQGELIRKPSSVNEAKGNEENTYAGRRMSIRQMSAGHGEFAAGMMREYNESKMLDRPTLPVHRPESLMLNLEGNNTYQQRPVLRNQPSNRELYSMQRSNEGGRQAIGRLESMDMDERVWLPKENNKRFVDARNRYEPLTSGLFSTVLQPIANNTTLKDKNSIPTKENTEKKLTPNGDIVKPTSLPTDIKKESSATKTPTRKPPTPDPNTTNNTTISDKKKVPMNKVTVGAAPSPNLKEVRSKIGSLENYTHKPGGGKVKIENRKLEWKVQPRIEAKNDQYAPSGGVKKIPQVKLQWNAKSKIGSLDNATHKPGGGDKKIESVKLDFKDKAKSKVGSKDNIKHTPGGGTVKKRTDADAKSISSDIEDQKIEIKAQSKVGSLDNVKHRPGGGDKKIFDDKDYLKQMPTPGNEGSRTNSVTTSGSQVTDEIPKVCDTKPKPNTDELSSKLIPATTSSSSHKLTQPPQPNTKPSLPEIAPPDIQPSKSQITPPEISDQPIGPPKIQIVLASTNIDDEKTLSAVVHKTTSDFTQFDTNQNVKQLPNSNAASEITPKSTKVEPIVPEKISAVAVELKSKPANSSVTSSHSTFESKPISEQVAGHPREPRKKTETSSQDTKGDTSSEAKSAFDPQPLDKLASTTSEQQPSNQSASSEPQPTTKTSVSDSKSSQQKSPIKVTVFDAYPSDEPLSAKSGSGSQQQLSIKTVVLESQPSDKSSAQQQQLSMKTSIPDPQTLKQSSSEMPASRTQPQLPIKAVESDQASEKFLSATPASESQQGVPPSVRAVVELPSKQQLEIKSKPKSENNMSFKSTKPESNGTLPNAKN